MFDTARWTVPAPLLQATTAGRDLLDDTIRRLTPEAVTQVVLDEIGSHDVRLDLHNVSGPRIMTVQGDQSDAEFLDRLGKELGPFDVVADDGSHLNEHVQISFHALFPHVLPGGLDVVEDLQTAYWPSWGGDPSGGEGTSAGMLKSFVDGPSHAEVGGPAFFRSLA